MKIKQLPISERPMEKMMIIGSNNLSNGELLGILIGTGTKNFSAIDLANKLILKLDGELLGLQTITMQELMSIKGIGKSKACNILAAIELAKRIKINNKQNFRISESKDVAEMMMEELRYKKKEYFICLHLNVKGEVIYKDIVSIGSLSQTEVHPREVFYQAIKRSAASVIFVHNHPSGDSTPSKEDVMITKRLIEVGLLLGINVLDHIVIGNGKYNSLLDDMLIEN